MEEHLRMKNVLEYLRALRGSDEGKALCRLSPPASVQVPHTTQALV